MTLEEIKAAVDAGKTVHWANDGYRVIKDRIGQYLIAYGEGTSYANYIGLTWVDGVTLNGKPSEFYLGLDKVTRAYLESALWSSNDESTPSGGEPLDRNYGVEDFSAKSVLRASNECAAFVERMAEARAVWGDKAEEEGVELDEGSFTSSDVGHDFWLSRNGHGVGFQDRPEKYGEELAEVYQDLARAAGECYVFVGDDGEIYIE